MKYINPQVSMYLEKIYNARRNKDKIEITDLVRSLIKREDSIIVSLIWKYGDVKTRLQTLPLSIEQCMNEANLFKNEEIRMEELEALSELISIKDLEVNRILLKYMARQNYDWQMRENSKPLSAEDLDIIRKAVAGFKLDETKSIYTSYNVIYILHCLLIAKGEYFTIQDMEEFIIAQWNTDLEKLFKMYSIDCYTEEIQKIMIKYTNKFNRKLIKNKSKNSETEIRAKEKDNNQAQQKNESNLQDYKNIPKKIVLDKDMQTFCTILNDEFSENQMREILGRDKEVEGLFDILLKRTKRNAILVGEAGVGKTAIVEELTRRIVAGQCPEELKGCVVIQIDTNSIIAGTKYRGEAEIRFKKIQTLLTKYPYIIAFIDETHTVLGAGACEESSADMGNALKPILAKNNARIIGATTSLEYDKYFNKDPAFKRRFEKIEVKAPKIDQVYDMIKNRVKALEKYHDVKISKKMVEKCIYMASCFNMKSKNPDRTIDLLDKVMAKAKKLNYKNVNVKCIENVYASNYEKYNAMTIEEKKLIAYHEAGHYIVDKTLLGKNKKFIAVTIVPADDYLGANLYEKIALNQYLQTKTDLVNDIASYLGGRIAEKMYNNDLSSGASDDLKCATQIAYSMITKYGMGIKIGNNRVYEDSPEDKMYNESIISSIDIEVNKVISKAYALAEKILKDNKVTLDIIVEKLLQNGIVSGKELDEIVKQNEPVNEIK